MRNDEFKTPQERIEALRNARTTSDNRDEFRDVALVQIALSLETIAKELTALSQHLQSRPTE